MAEPTIVKRLERRFIPLLEAAVNGYADALVTHNVRDFLPAMQAFGLNVLTPAALLEELTK